MIYSVEPVLNYRTWGGNYLKECFNRNDIQEPVGEVFLVSSLIDAQSKINGIDFNSFYKQHPEYFKIEYDEFPLRINLIDAQDDLSVQLHPQIATIGNKKLDKGVEEAWYIIKANSDSKIVFGLNTDDIEEVQKCIYKNLWEDILHTKKVKSGDFAFLPAGYVHSIGKGCLVYEVTYNVDVTYRLYDYQRLDKKTNTYRELHHQEGLENLNLHDKMDLISTSNDKHSIVFVQDKGFKLEKIVCDQEVTLDQDNFYFYTVIEGQGTINGLLTSLFGTYFIPKTENKVTIKGQLKMLRVTYIDK